MSSLGRCIGTACGALVGMGITATTHRADIASIGGAFIGQKLSDTFSDLQDQWEEKYFNEQSHLKDIGDNKPDGHNGSAKTSESKDASEAETLDTRIETSSADAQQVDGDQTAEGLRTLAEAVSQASARVEEDANEDEDEDTNTL